MMYSDVLLRAELEFIIGHVIYMISDKLVVGKESRDSAELSSRNIILMLETAVISFHFHSFGFLTSTRYFVQSSTVEHEV